MLFKIGTDNNYYSKPLLQCLVAVKNLYNFDVEKSDSIPRYSIWAENKPVAYIDITDGHQLRKNTKKIVDRLGYKIIFKYHVNTKHNYGKYGDKVIPCGLYRQWKHTLFDKQDLLTRERPIDVVALMRWSNSSVSKSSQVPWAIARRTIIAQAQKLQKNGYNVKSGSKIDRLRYEKILLDTKIGFIWSASAYLGWKIPEFTQQGVVMITEPLGEKYPLINNTIFEDGVHCIFCNNPDFFEQAAIELLNDEKRLNLIRKNVVELWEEKLAPIEVGKFLYRKLQDAM